MADTIQEWVKQITKGDRRALSQAITLLESQTDEDYLLSLSLMEAISAKSKESLRLGISGLPGVGKSSFIEQYGMQLIHEGHRVAVLAIDPSSVQNKGAILGDKIRMTDLANHPQAFVRPSPSSGHLGGVTQRMRDVILLCEAAGYDRILIETVGVGQSEIELSHMVDVFLYFMLPESGDDIQALKRGIFEVADLVIINKAEGENINLAKRLHKNIKSSFSLLTKRESGWTVPICLLSLQTQEGYQTFITKILEFETYIKSNGFFEKQRDKQAALSLTEEFNHQFTKMSQALSQRLLAEFLKTNTAKGYAPKGIYAFLKEKLQ